MSDKVVPVVIDILGKEYTIACPLSERDELLRSAGQLRERLQRIREGGRVMGAERMMVITALNLLHDLKQQEHRQSEMQRAVEYDIQRLEEKLGSAITRRPGSG